MTVMCDHCGHEVGIRELRACIRELELLLARLGAGEKEKRAHD